MTILRAITAAPPIGFQPSARPTEWTVPTPRILSLTGSAVMLGLTVKSPEDTSDVPLPPCFGSGFVPTDPMPTALHRFAE
ncbi:hypothetical protein ACQEU3_43425 [Spirillospora sp. CA-253888]